MMPAVVVPAPAVRFAFTQAKPLPPNVQYMWLKESYSTACSSRGVGGACSS